MIKFLFVGDLHIRGTNPRNRKDDYKETLKLKLHEIFRLAVKHDVKAILMPGDIFDRPEVSIAVLLEFADVLKKSPVTIYTTVGNHDIYGYNIETYNRSSLKILSLIVEQLRVRTGELTEAFYDGLETKVAVSYTPYSAKMDINGYGYSPEETDEDYYKIHIAHGMLLDHTPPFDRFTLLQDVKTDADLILNGHDHIGYGIFRRQDGKVFVNPGSLTRLSASVNEIERPVQVALIEVEGKSADVKLIRLEAARPGDEVLDRSKIEAEAKRAYAMEQFSALIQTKTGDKVLLDVNQIVSEIAKNEGYKPEVIQAALERIDQQRENVIINRG